MNPFDKAWDVLKIQDWRADNPYVVDGMQPNQYPKPSSHSTKHLMGQTTLSEFDPKMYDPKMYPNWNNKRTQPIYDVHQDPLSHPQSGDPITEQRNNPMAQVNPNIPKHFQEANQSPNQPPPPPNMDPSWTPEAIARINAQNDEARRALRGGQ